jgi:excisionase family DNA binding protein
MGTLTETWELWTWREVCRVLKVSRSWVYAKAESGDLPSLRIGGGRGSLRFDPVAIQKFVSQGVQNATVVHVSSRKGEGGSRGFSVPEG